MTAAALFNQLKAGKISKKQFLYEVRRDQNLPFISPLTTFKEAIQILQNKRIINEVFEMGSLEEACSCGGNYESHDDAGEMVCASCGERKPLGEDNDTLTKGAYRADKLGSDVLGEDGDDELEDIIAQQDAEKQGEEDILSQWDVSENGGDDDDYDPFYDREEEINYGVDDDDREVDDDMEGNREEDFVSLREQVQEFVKNAMKGGSSMDEAKELAREYFNKKESLNEAVGNFELKKLARELYSVVKKVNGVTGVKIVTSDIKNAASAFQATAKKGNTFADDAVMAEIYVNEADSFISIILSGTSKVLNPVAGEVNKQLQAYVNKNYTNQLDAQYVKAPNDNTMLGINVKFKGDVKKEGLNEAAKPKLTVDQVNPYEFKKGVNIEMGVDKSAAPDWSSYLGDLAGDIQKAQAKVLKNLAKDPAYYTNQIAGKHKEKKAPVVKADGYVKSPKSKMEKSNVKTTLSKTEKAKGNPQGVKMMKEDAFSKIREYVTKQLKKEDAELVKSATTGETIDVVPTAQAAKIKANLQKKGVRTVSTKV